MAASYIEQEKITWLFNGIMIEWWLNLRMTKSNWWSIS